MMDVLRVFISGTQEDMQSERQAVEEAIHSLRWEALRAETYGSQPMPSRATCQEMMERCDIYLGMFSGRYGWELPEGISVTEFEFNLARKLNRSILVYVRDEEREPKQSDFLKRVEDFDGGYFRRPPFEFPEEVAGWVQEDLTALVTRLIREGGIRSAPFQARPDIPTFVGRREELARLTEALGGGDTVAVHGVHGLFGLAGLGKTALAIHAVYWLREDFPDGVLWVDLPTARPAEVLANWARLYGGDVSRIENIETRADAVRGILRGKRILAVLDDARSDESLPPLLRALSDCAVIVTSRITNLPSLVHATPVDLDKFSPDEVWALFNCIVTDRRLKGLRSTVEAIGELVGYLPLALDIAAKKMRKHKNWMAEDLLERLRDAKSRLGELQWAGDYGVRMSFSLSYEGLSSKEQRFFAALGAFGGEDFDVTAAAAVAQVTEKGASKALEVLFNLSLFEEGRRAGRYRLHPLLRDYAREKLEGEGAYERMARHYLAVAREAAEELEGKEIEDGLAVLDEELSNIRAGQAWAAGKATKAAQELTRDYIDAMVRYLDLRSHWDEWIDWGEVGLEACQQLDDEGGTAAILSNLGLVYYRKGEWDRAIKLHQKSLRTYERLSDTHGMAQAYNGLGMVYADKGEWDTAIKLYQKGLEISEKLGNAYLMAKIYNNAGLVYADKGEWDRAIEVYQRSLEISKKLGDVHLMAKSYNNIGLVYAEKGEWDRAIEFYQKDLFISERLDDARGMAQTYNNLGMVYDDKGEWDKAIELYQKSLEILEKIGGAHLMARAYNNLGVAYANKGEWDRAIESYQKSLEISEKLKDVHVMAETYSNVGLVYCRKGEWDSAIEFCQRSLEMSEKLGDVHLMAESYNNVGLAYADKGEWAKSIELYQKSLEIRERLGDAHGMAQTWGNLGYLYEAQEDYCLALEYAAMALEIFRRLGAWEAAQMEELVRRLREKLPTDPGNEYTDNSTAGFWNLR